MFTFSKSNFEQKKQFAKEPKDTRIRASIQDFLRPPPKTHRRRKSKSRDVPPPSSFRRTNKSRN